MDIEYNTNINLESECPLNNKKCISWKFLYTTKFNEYRLPIFYCENCNLQKIHPAPSSIEDFYTKEYYTGKSEYSYIDERRTHKFHSYVWNSRLDIILKEYKKKFESFPNRPFRLLEIGSSFGGFLSCAKKRGMEVLGIEISEYASSYANMNHIPTLHGTLDNSNLPKSYYDVIVLSEVIEHLPNPRLIFDILHASLNHHSILVIQTANFEGWQARNEKENYHYYLPGHLFYYSESNLKKILKTRGNYQFKVFYGSDVSLISKWKKMRGSFQTFSDYLKWFKTGYYHFKSKLKYKGFPMTSGFVLYAFKGGRDLERVE